MEEGVSEARREISQGEASRRGGGLKELIDPIQEEDRLADRAGWQRAATGMNDPRGDDDIGGHTTFRLVELEGYSGRRRSRRPPLQVHEER